MVFPLPTSIGKVKIRYSLRFAVKISTYCREIQAEKIEKEKEKEQQRVKKRAEQKKQYLTEITRADDLYEKQKWQAAIEAYSKAKPLFLKGFQPNQEAINQKMLSCNQELGFIEKMRTAQVAYTEKDYATTLSDLEEALKFKTTKEATAFQKNVIFVL